MRKAILPALASTAVFVVVAISIAYSGLGFEFERLFVGDLEDTSLLVLMLIVAYLPAFFAGFLTPLFERGWRAAVKTAFIASVISLVLGIILSVLVGISLGMEGVYGFIIWMSISAPLYFGVSLVSILIGYLLILVLIFVNK